MGGATNISQPTSRCACSATQIEFLIAPAAFMGLFTAVDWSVLEVPPEEPPLSSELGPSWKRESIPQIAPRLA